MSLGYLLDSDIIIYYLKGNKYYIDLVSNLQERGNLVCSVLNKYEILSGMLKEESKTNRYSNSSHSKYPWFNYSNRKY